MEAVCYTLPFVKNGEVKKYVGHTTNFRKRIRRHIGELMRNTHHNPILQALYNDGWRYTDEPEIITLPNKDLAREMEFSIIHVNRDNPEFVNIECGGDTFTNNPKKDEIREGLIQSLQEYLKSLSPEERKRVYGKSGSKNGMYGLKHTLQARKMISEKVKAFYNEYGSPLRGKAKSENHRAKISAFASTRLGERNSFFGRTHSQDTKDRISEANKGNLPPNTKKVSIDGTVYESLSQGAREMMVNPSVALWRINSNNPKFSDWKWFEMPND